MGRQDGRHGPAHAATATRRLRRLHVAGVRGASPRARSDSQRSTDARRRPSTLSRPFALTMPALPGESHSRLRERLACVPAFAFAIYPLVIVFGTNLPLNPLNAI